MLEDFFDKENNELDFSAEQLQKIADGLKAQTNSYHAEYRRGKAHDEPFQRAEKWIQSYANNPKIRERHEAFYGGLVSLVGGGDFFSFLILVFRMGRWRFGCGFSCRDGVIGVIVWTLIGNVFSFYNSWSFAEMLFDGIFCSGL